MIGFQIPVWSNNAAYDYTARLSRREWAWEFLRRNPEFRAAWRSAQLEYGIAGYDAGTTMIAAPFAKPSLAQWGVLYCTAPDQDAQTASVFWCPDMCSAVLRLTAFAVSSNIDATPFLLRDIACPSILLEMRDGPQHLLFAEEGRGLQLVIEGADIVHPVRLMTNSAPHAALANAQLRSLQCFNDLRLTGRLYTANLQRDPLSPRLRRVLRILDGKLSGASHETIAKAVLGGEYARDRWQGRGRTLRDRFRRAVRRGYDLMQGGYRDLLS